jgi:hypothetical protein
MMEIHDSGVGGMRISVGNFQILTGKPPNPKCQSPTAKSRST